MPLSSRTLAYRTAPKTDLSEREIELQSYLYHIDPLRDRIVPILMILFGVTLNVAHFVPRHQLGAIGMIQLAGVFAALGLAETAVMVAVAYAVNDWLDVTFGRFGTAILKFAGIVFFCDGVFAGLPIGLIPGHGFFGIIAAFLVYEFACMYLFRFSLNDSRAFVALVGVFYTLFHAILLANLVNVTILVGGVRLSPFVSPKLWRLRPRMAMVVPADSTAHPADSTLPASRQPI